MKNRSLLLLRTLLLSTSQINIYRHCEDRRKRRRIIGGMIGMTLLYVMLMVTVLTAFIALVDKRTGSETPAADAPV